MRYMVTGSAGFVGSHLYEALRERGHDVVGLDSFTDYYDVALKEENARGQQLLRLDLARDPLDLAGFDGVFHLAGQPGVRSFGDVFETYLDRNVLASQRLFEAAAHDGVRVVLASSSSVYGEAEAYPTAEDVPPRPVSPYGITKLACEHLARATSHSFGLDVVVLRYFNVYGPRMDIHGLYTEVLIRWMERIAAGQPPLVLGDGRQTMDFVFTSDIARANLRAAEADVTDAVFNIGTSTETSLLELAEALLEVMGRSDLAVELGPARAVNGVTRRLASIDAAQQQLGWKPEVDLRSGLAALVDWWRAEREDA